MKNTNVGIKIILISHLIQFIDFIRFNNTCLIFKQSDDKEKRILI